MAKLFEGNIVLKNKVSYDVDYKVSASYTGSTSTLLNGGNGLDGSITFKVKSTTYAWSKDVTVGIVFGGGNASKSAEISIDKDDYTTHSVSFSVAPSKTEYGSIGFWIKNNGSNESRTLITYSTTGISQLGSGVTNLHTGGLCGIYPSESSPTTSLTGSNILLQQGETLGQDIINLNYYWTSPIFKAEITHSSGYEKRTPSYKIAFYGYKVDGTRTNYPTTQEYSWTINKTNYTETIQQSLPLFLKEGSSSLDYPIRKYFLYYNGSHINDSFYVTPFSFDFPDIIIAKQSSGSNYEAEVNLGNLNKWIDLKYSNLNLTFKAQSKTGEITKIDNVLVGKVSDLTGTDPNLLAYEIYKDNTLIISKEINTIFGLDFSVTILGYTKSYSSGDFSALQRGEEMTLSVGVAENSGSLTNEEVKIALIVKNTEGQEKEIYSIEEGWKQGETKNIAFSNITINELIEINSEKVNKFYLKITSGGTEKLIDLGKEIYAYDYVESMVLNDKIGYNLISGQDRVNGLCDIKEGSILGIAFPQGQFKDSLSIRLIFGNYLYDFNSSSFQKEIKYDILKELLNNLSEHIIITPTQKNTKEISYEIQYSYGSGYQTISTEEKLIITIPPLLIPTLAYRSKQVGINCEPSEASVLDIKAEGNFTKVRFQNSTGTETGYIDLQNGGLKDSDENDIYLKPSEAADTYLTKTSAADTYLKTSDAESTYLDKDSAASTYLTQTSAASTYQKKIKHYSNSENKTVTGRSSSLATSWGRSTFEQTFNSDFSEVGFYMGAIELGEKDRVYGHISSISKSGTTITAKYWLANGTDSSSTVEVTIKVIEII